LKPTAEIEPMICQFCKQEVESPCHDVQDMRQRAISRVECCEDALRDEMRDDISPSDGQSSGSV